MRERDVELFTIHELKKAGAIVWKFTSPGTAGVPDRFCAINGRCFFIEFKRPGHKRRSDEGLQKARHAELEKQGVKTYIIEDKIQGRLLARYAASGILPEVSHFGSI